MNIEDLRFFANVLQEQTGVCVTEARAYVMEVRLLDMVKRLDLKNLAELKRILEAKEPKVMAEFIDTMVENDTMFFREPRVFQRFKEMVLPFVFKNKKEGEAVRILSAGCSSGQEPYSIAMLLTELQPELKGQKFEIVAVDISQRLLQKALHGGYSQFDVQRGLPIRYLPRFFDKNEAGEWVISEEIKKQVMFYRANLLANLKGLGLFEIVFLKDVLEYMDAGAKTRILNNLAAVMKPSAALILGEGENISDLSPYFKAVKGVEGIYLKAAEGAGNSAAAG